jgi:antitoxin component HigA of HigAB toxin-antitoxin module
MSRVKIRNEKEYHLCVEFIDFLIDVGVKEGIIGEEALHFVGKLVERYEKKIFSG